MHLQGSIVVSWFHHPPFDMDESILSTTVFTLSTRKTALTLVPYLMHLARLKWQKYDECALANPNRCKVEIGLMHEGSARAGIIVIGGIFR